MRLTIPELAEPTFSRRRVRRTIVTLLWVSIPAALSLLLGTMMSPSLQYLQNSR